MRKLPQELIDKIFLLLDYKTLNNCRELQSNYVKQCTKYIDSRKCIENGFFLNLKWLYYNNLLNLDYHTFADAAYIGNIEIMNWLISIGCEYRDDYVFYKAVCCGNLNIIKWLHSLDIPWDTGTFEQAGYSGNIDLLEWLKEKGCPWDSKTFDSVVYSGCMNKLQWLMKNKCPYNLISAMYDAILSKNIKIMDYIYSIGNIQFNIDYIYTASQSGSIEVLEWFYNKGYKLDSTVFCRALEHNNIEILEWLKHKGCPYNYDELEDYELLYYISVEVRDWMNNNGYDPSHHKCY